MDNALYYLALNRQNGLAAEMDMIANNIANMDTTGFRREGLAFTEFVLAAERGESVSMADLGAKYTNNQPGNTRTTGARFDLAVEGEGYFLIETPDGLMLTRAGGFQVSAEGFISTPDGHRLLDIGEAAIPVPANSADVLIAADGTVSANGEPIAQVALMTAPEEMIKRVGDTAFQVVDDAFEPVPFPKIRQGALEQSNVDPVLEISRMIQVTRSYEMAQSLIEDEDERIREAVRTLGQG